MEITTSQREYILNEERINYPVFCNSEMYSKDNIKSIFNEIISHGQIFDIILDKGTDNYTRRIEAFSEEEALSLKMIMSDKFEKCSFDILRNAVQYKNIRLFFIDEANKDTYYYLLDFMHDNNFYISIFLLKDFPTDSFAIQYSVIKDTIELYFATAFKKLGIPVGYTEYDEMLCFPDKLRPSDFKFMAYYYAYYFEALATFIPEDAIINSMKDDALSVVINIPQYIEDVFNDRHKALSDDKEQAIEYANMITSYYFQSLIALASIAGAQFDVPEGWSIDMPGEEEVPIDASDDSTEGE